MSVNQIKVLQNMIITYNMEGRLSSMDVVTCCTTTFQFFNACEIGDCKYVELVLGDSKRDWGE